MDTTLILEADRGCVGTRLTGHLGGGPRNQQVGNAQSLVTGGELHVTRGLVEIRGALGLEAARHVGRLEAHGHRDIGRAAGRNRDLGVAETDLRMQALAGGLDLPR